MYDTDTAPTGAAETPELLPWEKEVLARQAQREKEQIAEDNYVMAADPQGDLREYVHCTLARIEKAELMLDRLTNEVMAHCGERLVDDKSLKQSLDKTRMATSLIRGYQHLIDMRDALITREAVQQSARDAARAEYRATKKSETLADSTPPSSTTRALPPQAGELVGVGGPINERYDANSSPVHGGSIGVGAPMDTEQSETEGATGPNDPAGTGATIDQALTGSALPDTAKTALKSIRNDLRQTANMREPLESLNGNRESVA